MESQKAINYITWESSRTVANSPFLEKPRKNRYDALCVTELLGEYAVQELREFGYHKLSCSTKTDEAGEEKKLGERKAMLEPIFKPVKGMLRYKVGTCPPKQAGQVNRNADSP